MGIVKYKVGEETFGFETDLQIVSDEALFSLEEHLMEEIKGHKHHLNPQPRCGYIHDVVFEDDNKLIATVKDFTKLGNLILKPSKI